jgi:hypothetical protein
MKKRKTSGRRINDKKRLIYVAMSDQQLIRFIKKNCKGSTVTNFQKKFRGAFKQSRERNLLEKLISAGIISRSRRERGKVDTLTNDELISYIDNNFRGLTIGELERKDRTIHNYAKSRDLIDNLVERGVLKRIRFPSGHYSKLSDSDLISYIETNFKGMQISKFRKKSSATAKIIDERNLMPRLVEEKVLVRERKERGFFKDKKDIELLDYIKSHYQGYSISRFRKEDGSAYNEVSSRGLLQELQNQGIILIYRQEMETIDNSSFISFLQQDETARNLAAAAAALNGHGADVENIIMKAYEGKFKDQKQLHDLIKENRAEIYKLVQEGVTNLGQYIGEFSLEDRTIIPVFLGQALTGLPERVRAPLEDKLVYILRNVVYSPRFNANPQAIISELERRIEEDSPLKQVYQKLHRHYSETLALEEVLN